MHNEVPAHKEEKVGSIIIEVVVSAITGDLVHRAISFLIKRMSNHLEEEEEEERKKKKMERLQRLLARVHMVVEEAEGRYITNSRMLLELKRFVDGMYQGYHVLNTVRSSRSSSPSVQDHDEVIIISSSSSMTSSKSNTALSSSLTSNSCINCFHPLTTKSSTTRRGTSVCGGDHLELESAVDSLETMVSDMTEFVLLLGGCERMLRSPYDAHLYLDNFMFGRQVEKQQVISFLLRDDNNLPPDFAPAVLPIVGTSRVGKKTLVAHVCDIERVRSHFSSILRLTISTVESMSSSRTAHHDQEGGLRRRTLFVVEFSSNDDDIVDDESWQKFYRSATRIGGRGSKIIVITRSEKLSARLGTVTPVRLNSLSLQEYSYLFKVLAFGSTNPEEHPRLASVADELAVLTGGSLVTANVCADVLRNNQSIHMWLHVLNKYRNAVANNLSTFSEHPKLLMERNRRIDITKLVSASASAAPPRALYLMPPHSEEDETTRCLQKVKFVDLIAGSAVLPKDQEFELVACESRIAPYKRIFNVATFSDEMNNVSEPEHHRSPPSPDKKRRRNHP